MLQRRHLIIASLLALALLAAYWLLRPRPILVEVAPVTEQPFTMIVEEDGRTRVRDRFVVSAPLAGRVPRSTLRAGDVVKAGQSLATITPYIAPLLDPRVQEELKERVGQPRPPWRRRKPSMSGPRLSSPVRAPIWSAPSSCGRAMWRPPRSSNEIRSPFKPPNGTLPRPSFGIMPPSTRSSKHAPP
jgi:hypothetical protein